MRNKEIDYYDDIVYCIPCIYVKLIHTTQTLSHVYIYSVSKALCNIFPLLLLLKCKVSKQQINQIIISIFVADDQVYLAHCKWIDSRNILQNLIWRERERERERERAINNLSAYYYKELTLSRKQKRVNTSKYSCMNWKINRETHWSENREKNYAKISKN